MKILNRIIISMPFLALAGCATTGEVTYYKAPSEQSAATFVGTSIDIHWPREDKIVYVSTIDGAYVKGQLKAYAQPLAVAPGKHTIQITYRQAALNAQIALPMTVESNGEYVTKFEPQGGSHVAIWIENINNGTPVTEKLIAEISLSGGTVFVPVF